MCGEVQLFTRSHRPSRRPHPTEQNVLNVAARASQPAATASRPLSVVRAALALLALILALGSEGGRVDRLRWRSGGGGGGGGAASGLAAAAQWHPLTPVNASYRSLILLSFALFDFTAPRVLLAEEVT